MFAKTRRFRYGWPAVAVVMAVALTLVVACGGGDKEQPVEEDLPQRLQEIEVLVQAGDVDEARQRFDEPHRLLHMRASALAPRDPELSQQLDSATEELQRELLRASLDPDVLSEVVSRLVQLLAQTEAIGGAPFAWLSVYRRVSN